MLRQVLRTSRCAAQRRSLLLHTTRLASVDAALGTATRSNRPPPTSLRTAYVRTWRPLANIADAYAMIRVLERKYGKVIEVHFLKDFELPINYQSISWVVFKDPKSLQRIPEKGFEFTIPVTGVRKEPHEIGMADIEHLAQEGDYEEGFELAIVNPEANQRVIGGRIIRAEQDFIPEHIDRRIYQVSAKPVMRSFLQWGGFSKLTPLDPSRRIEEGELFRTETDTETGSRLDSIRMRAALQLAAYVTNSQNPSVVNRESDVGASAVRSTNPNTSETAGTVGLRKAGEPSFGEMAFGLAGGSSSSNASETSEMPLFASDSPSIPEPTLSSPSPSSSTASLNTTPPFSPISAFPTPLASRKKSPPTPAQLAEKEALQRQLEVARQLREQVVAPRRKQPKPSLNVRGPKKGGVIMPREPEFFEEDALSSKRMEANATPKESTRPGVLMRLWGMFGRK